MAKDEKLEGVLYYLIEKANKTARRYSQERFYAANINVTIDQWLVMKKINDSDRISQAELGEALFKDRASITRILDLLLKKKLVRKEVGADQRAYELILTEAGKKFVEKALSEVKAIRKKGIEGLTEKEVEQLKQSLQKIINNLQ